MCMHMVIHSFSLLTYAYTRLHHSFLFLFSLPPHIHAHTLMCCRCPEFPKEAVQMVYDTVGVKPGAMGLRTRRTYSRIKGGTLSVFYRHTH
jgi:hypothetical protein